MAKIKSAVIYTLVNGKMTQTGAIFFAPDSETLRRMIWERVKLMAISTWWKAAIYDGDVVPVLAQVKAVVASRAIKSVNFIQIRPDNRFVECLRSDAFTTYGKSTILRNFQTKQP